MKKSILITAVAILGVSLAAGCGGASSGSTAATHPATTSFVKHKKAVPSKHAVMSNTLWAFLGQVQTVRVPYNRLNDQVNTADQKVGVCCTDWAAAATVNHVAAKRAKAGADALAAMVAPAALERVYLAYAADYRTAGLAYAADAAGLRSQGNFQWSNTSAAPVTRFRVALIEYAAVNHLTLPRWVHGIGGR